jgi:hypothetical protein
MALADEQTGSGNMMPTPERGNDAILEQLRDGGKHRRIRAYRLQCAVNGLCLTDVRETGLPDQALPRIGSVL